MKKQVASAIALMLSTGALLTSLGISINYASKQNQNNVQLNKECRNIRITQAYIEAKHDYERSVLKACQEGSLTQEEYANKLEYTSTNDFIYDNIDSFVSEDKAEEIKTRIEDKKTVQDTGEIALLTALCSVVGCGIGLSGVMSDKKDKDQDGSIMSRCRYKDLLEKETEEKTI